jgi:hypothetical protein
MFGNMVMRMFGVKINKVKQTWRKLHKDELRKLYFSPLIIRVIKLRSIKCSGHEARMRETRNAYKIFGQKT